MREPRTSLYILTYNSPDQVRSILSSFENSDRDFLDKPRKILIDNSTDLSTGPEYQKIAEKYNLEIIKKDNIGIASGRQFVAEHFQESDAEYYIFFEDDMHLISKTEERCGAGYKRYIPNLYQKSLAIMERDKLDFLKLTYSEFFGNNSFQWAWYNIPQDIREKFFSGNSTLPEQFGDPHIMPKTIPKARRQLDGLHYLIGDYHFCNWPLWFSKKGNFTLFLDTIWRYPYEQTIMSWGFQLQKASKLECGVLELSPIHHERFEHYPGEDRVEVT